MNCKKFYSNQPTIGLLIAELERMYHLPLWQGINDACIRKNINLIIFTGEAIKTPRDYYAQSNAVYDLVNPEQLDGLIIASGSIGNYIELDEMEEFCGRFDSLPMVSISLPIKGIPSLLIDNQEGMKEAINHLIVEHGRKRMVFIRGPVSNSEAEQRYKAYLECLAEHNIPFDPELVLQGDFGPNSGVTAINNFLNRQKVKFDAVIGANDSMALEVLNTLSEKGYKIPEEIAVIGFDDCADAQFSSPPLTTVKQSMYHLGQKATAMLMEIIEEKRVFPEKTLFPTQLVIRQSCGCLPLPEIEIKESKEQVIVSSIESFITHLHRNKSMIVPEVINSLSAPNEDEANLKSDVEQLFEAYLEALGSIQGYNSFFHTLNEILTKSILFAKVVYDWQNAIYTMEKLVLNILPIGDEYCFTVDLFQKAQIIAGEVMRRREAFRNLEITRLNWLLNQIDENISLVTDIDALIDILIEALPALGLRSCFFSLFNDTEHYLSPNSILPLKSTLFLAYDRNNYIEKENYSYPTVQLIPERYLPIRNRFTWIIKTLHHQEKAFGYTTFDLGNCRETIYAALQGQMSIALRIIDLWKRREQAEEELRSALLKLEKSNKKLKDLTLLDPLTGLYNRRGFFLLGEKQYKIAKREGKSFLLCYIDVDDFKQVNDKYGHKEGDLVLINVAQILKETFRESDIISRIGGDEFIVFIHEGTLKISDNIMKRLRDNIQEFNKAENKPYNISISLGFSMYEYNSEITFEALVLEADRKLYEAKRGKKSAE
jgi:diguanylate cyclase (GGDEF)-like protein